MNDKGKGKKIAIKFTEDLIGDVSAKFPHKSYRFYKWEFYDSQHSGNQLYLYEIELYFEGSKYSNSGVKEVTGSSQSSTSYAPAKAFDDSTSTHWRTSTSFTLPHWLIVELNNPVAIDNFKWYVTGSYKPDGFALFGSTDGENWDRLYEGNSPNSNGWHSFDISKKGNKTAFTVTGKEHQWVEGPNNNGPLIDCKYEVDTVEMHPTEEKTLLLTMKDHNWFRNVEGELTVNYDMTKGNLTGSGGFVESFEEVFEPDGLTQKPNVGTHESFEITASASIDFIEIEFKDYNYEENFKITASATVDFIEIDEENP